MSIRYVPTSPARRPPKVSQPPGAFSALQLSAVIAIAIVAPRPSPAIAVTTSTERELCQGIRAGTRDARKLVRVRFSVRVSFMLLTLGREVPDQRVSCARQTHVVTS